MSKVKAIPEGYHSVTPFLSLKDASKAIKFYKEAFGAKEIEVHQSTDDRIMHAVLKIGDSLIMLADEFSESKCGIASPRSLQGTTIVLHLYVEDADKVFQKAVKAGATVKMPIQDTFWGDRYGQVEDPFGHLWSIATHKVDLTPDQVEKGATEWLEENQIKSKLKR
jgi:PhnB protein